MGCPRSYCGYKHAYPKINSMPEIGLEILASICAALLGALLPIAKQLVRDLRKRHTAEEFFSSRFGGAILATLGLGVVADSPKQMFTELTETSQRLDRIVTRIQDYTTMRESAVAELETKLENLSAQEGRLRQTIEQLQNVPLPAAEHFAQLIKKEEKGSALRDYALFVAGVIVSAVVSIVLKHYGIG
jgi:hypothetical protein